METRSIMIEIATSVCETIATKYTNAPMAENFLLKIRYKTNRVITRKMSSCGDPATFRGEN